MEFFKHFRVLTCCLPTAIASPAQIFNTLVNFNGTNGASPSYNSSLVQGLDGNFYGTTPDGGTLHGGNVFKMTPQGKVTVLHSFAGPPEGAVPMAGLTLGTDGNFYGTTNLGGTAYGYGTVFKITPKGVLTTLHTFCASDITPCADGANPIGGLVQGWDGNFYGTTNLGGGSNLGTVFRITPRGKLTTLYSFCKFAGCADGYFLTATLLLGPGGNFYGTTVEGGANNDGGTLFQMTPSGTLTTLYSFCALSSPLPCYDGQAPYNIAWGMSDFWVTTNRGGVSNGGTLAALNIAGALKDNIQLCTADNVCPMGDNPYAGLVAGIDSTFYGTTEAGGANNGGTIFSWSYSSPLTLLHSFDSPGGPGGSNPYAALVEGTDGNFYGTTSQGGTKGYGTIFRLSMGLTPFIRSVPVFGKVGTPVKILGTDLTGATSVTFNGTAAAFTVVSPSLITTTVPVGATTGTVQVVTPSGTLSGNGPFRVLP